MDLTVFDHFPEPVFHIHNRRLRYSNPSALALEPEWAAGRPLPEALDMEPDEEGVFSCVAGGQRFQAAATRMGDGSLLLVLRRPAAPSAPRQVAALPPQLRVLLNELQAAARPLFPLVEEAGDEDARRRISVISQSFYRLLRLARHLELSQLAEREDLSQAAKTPLDLAQLCRDVCYRASGLARPAGVDFQENLPGGVLPTVGDKGLLEVMLLELISNALKAAGPGGKAGLTLATNGQRALITVWDDGPGLDQADLTAVMDGSSPQSLPKPGTGLRLGLPIARYAAAAHGGAILLESREGQGLRATACIPLRKPGKADLRAPTAAAEESFPTDLTLLSDALPWQAFEEAEK